MMKIPKLLLSALIGMAMFSVNMSSKPSENQGKKEFVRVKDGEFYIGDSLYRYVGANFWYGALLASEKYGDRDRLAMELDTLRGLGIDNLRILVGGDGDEGVTSHIEPVLQRAPGVYNDTLLQGLDYLIAEMEKRDMKGVFYLNNSWEWSGGYSTYLEWTGHGRAPLPNVDGYQPFVDYAKQFVLSDSAKQLAMNHVKNIVSRTNSVTGEPYKDSPAIMSWQIANEPRSFSREGKRALADWLRETAQVIKEIDPNHLVSTGSEGKYGCQVDLDLWAEIHSYPEIDYANIHIWPYNWQWIGKESVVENLDTAKYYTMEYIDEHYDRFRDAGKPIVLEEFGYPRDNMAIAPGSATTGRDQYYEYVFSIIRDSGKINGANFWGWGGYAEPSHRTWERGDDYSGDPAQEDQGLNSVFLKDSTTVKLIKRINEEIQQITKEMMNSPKEKLRNTLGKLSEEGKIAFGHADDTVYGHSWAWDHGNSDVKSVTGDYPGVINWDLGGIEKGDEANLDGVPFSRMREEIIAQDARGGINVLSWHTVNPVDGGDSWQCSDTTIVSKILTDDVTGKAFEEQVARVAAFINSLEDETGRKIGVVFRPWHEHTGNWFWWGSAQCTPEEYKQLWAKTREITDSEGTENILWAYSPDRVKSYEEYMERYPGDGYVDIMGADVYCYGGERGVDVYKAAVENTLGAASLAAKERGKLVAFTETGLESIPSEDWWTEVLLPAMSEYPISYVVVWRNAHDKPNHYYAPWPGQVSADNFKKFHEDSRTAFAKDVQELK